MNEEMNTTAVMEDAVLDSAWEDEDGGFEMEDEAQTPEADQPEGEQQPADQPTAPETEADPASVTDSTADQPEMFEIVYRGQREQLTREQMIINAQKGRDYDTVRAERDALKAEQAASAGAMELVKGYAQRMGMDVPQYLDWCRKQELLRGGLDEKQAEQTMQMEKRQADLDEREARLQAEQAQRDSVIQKAREEQAKRRADMQAFLKTYPDVKPDKISPEVWQRVAAGDSLVNAYTMSENARLQAELAAERQNRETRSRSPGSLAANSGTEMDELDRLWAEDD